MSGPFRIAIVGGGTAGWLSALVIREAGRRSDLNLDISVVESSSIPTVGVGEGTTSVFRGLLLELGLTNSNFCVKPEPQSSTASGTATGGASATSTTAQSMTHRRFIRLRLDPG
ncbi:tryptophan 7-halogenase [Rhodobacteraceae bacterium R_SAG10]|nr:tryptophan 7-halogenase [Rhodobacteraceae bacterium R_SAG10]